MTFVRDLSFCLLLASTGACFQKDEQCSCFPSSFAVNAPAGAVRDVKLSGAACADTRPTCLQGSETMDSCTKISVLGRSAGDCTVEVTFTDGRTFTRGSPLKAGEGCCGGFVPTDGKDSYTVP